MATVSRGLPKAPHLDVPKSEARELLKAWRAAQPEALDRIRRRHPKLHKATDSEISSGVFRLSDAQWVIAREYGFSNWTALKERILANSLAGQLETAIRTDDRETVLRILRANPKLLHIPVWSGNWGPPMSHAANLGRLEMIKAIAELGARDFQHAFDRALLQGKVECAKWLHQHGGKLAPGIAMGACETLNADGLQFLFDAGAPITDARGDSLAPLALAIETYCRNPARKHRVLEMFAQRGYKFPDTPIMAFHRGDVERLKQHLRSDPHLIDRRFSCPEIFPAELGCAKDGKSGMHGTPVDGTTLLHLSIDYDEQAIFDLLIEHGADVNARATVDSDGFGGHTPLFNTLVSCAYSCGRQRDAAMVRALLDRGASTSLRANIRKFLDWREEPGWHEAQNVTAVEWAQTFPERGWVNKEALQVING